MNRILKNVSAYERNLTFQLVEAALDADDDNVHCQLPVKDIKRLKDKGILKEDGKRLSSIAFSEYLTSFDLLTPPPKVEHHTRAWLEETIYWRKPVGKMRTLMGPQHRGKSFLYLRQYSSVNMQTFVLGSTNWGTWCTHASPKMNGFRLHGVYSSTYQS